ncbi:MAG: OadG family protein [Bacteroidetes bacterium]|nr:OadG family protein [Bacteroidota bacterium]
MTDSLNIITTDSLLVHSTEVADDLCVFTENDPYGLLMAVLGMSIVFFALVMLFIVFNNTPILFRQAFRDKLKSFFSFKKVKVTLSESTAAEETKQVKVEEISGEINAAIAAAIYLYRSELHDYEDTILTIKKVSRTYSPWSSKIYGLRNMPK